MAQLSQAGVTLLNQSVLLKGINDNLDTLGALSERMFSARILPYYIHLLDPVTGAGVLHFVVPKLKSKDLPAVGALRLSNEIGEIVVASPFTIEP